MSIARGPRGAIALITALGFFALVSQTLLFRDFLTVFEGNELGIGAFFTSWLVWVALGALAGRTESRAHRAFVSCFEFAALLYVPAFILQRFLVLHARGLAGVQSYEVFPFAPMFAASFLVNAPISFVTGLLFTTACRWVSTRSIMPVARVYILETLGSCAGGVAVTVLLAHRASPETAFLCAAWVLLAGVALSLLWPHEPAVPAPRRFRFGLLPMLVLVALFGIVLQGGLAARWAEASCRAAWARLLPADAYQGSFTTAQGRYLYGERAGQFVVMSGAGVCEALPPAEHAAEVAALHLAQNPAARSVLVFGEDSLGICEKLKAVPQIRNVAWLHPDPEYPKTLMSLLTAGHLPERPPDEIPGIDIRAFAQQEDRRYDLIILNLPDVTTLVLNRYCTEEFFALLKGILADNGIVSVRVSGGANFLGGELAYLGSSMVYTLERVFKRVTLKPGDETWVLASDDTGLGQAAPTLRDQFAAIPGASAIYPPEGILALYAPDRVAYQMDLYRLVIAKADPALLRSTDRAPKALLYALLVTLKQTGWRSLAAALPLFFARGMWIALCPIVLFGVLRLVYLLKSDRFNTPARAFDAHFLVFSTGLASMAFSVVLMFGYQSRFGSLFLDIGLVTALFMLGSFLGGGLIARFLRGSHGPHAHAMLFAILAVHICLLCLIAPPLGPFTKPVWGVLYVLCGFFTGVYFPMAAHRLNAAGRTVGVAGSDLETLDHVGGAAGAFLAGLLLLPILGGTASVWLLAALVAANIVPVIIPRRAPSESGDWFDRLVRPVGYALFGAAAFALIVSHFAAEAKEGSKAKRMADIAKLMAGADVEQKSVHLQDGSVFTYFVPPGPADAPPEYIFATGKWASKTYGYGGPIELVVYVDPAGVLRDYCILVSNETPAYRFMVESRKPRWVGMNVFSPDPFKTVDAVTGATITDNAFRKALETAGRSFAREVLHIDTGDTTQPVSSRPWWTSQSRDFIVLLLLMLSAIALRYRPRRWAHRIALLISLLATGLLLNLQFSMQQVLSLANLNVGSIGSNGPFFLLAAVPLLILLFGNVYCGYVCPFGAAQELLGDLWPARFDGNPGRRAWRYGRVVKYGLLFLMIVLFAVTRDLDVLKADPLVTAFMFSVTREPAAFALVIAALLLSVYYRRFWCRNLCPAGAFLSLLNGIRPLRRFLPPRFPQRCDLGVETTRELDCLYCDRCAFPSASAPKTAHSPESVSLRNAAFLVAVLALGVGFIAVTLSDTVTAISAAAPHLPQTAGKPRDVDDAKIKQLIRQGYLSDHPAEYHSAVPDSGAAAQPPDAP